MKREIVITADGSTTIHLPDWNEHYHSKHGAIREAYHVFINHGLCHFLNYELGSRPHKPISILEIGFGTGLNAFITLLEAEKLKLNIDYIGVEGYPVLKDEINLLNYPKELNSKENEAYFENLHDVSWNEKHTITSWFSLTKQQKMFHEVHDLCVFNIIYFDAFGARVQPELWTESIFQIMYNALKPNGILVTYAAKGSVRRAMKAVGFSVEKLPGPPGKREMLRATK
ncbi:tRNA (5-methylaminomethyl-2-thiouridine)(34)-methyltransferase MnmD [Litoribaculum gwangyangense]|uniref:tRNA (5-methylaminomethyl-2-thiouridine)(34)-methyltransferase MnmD n=1 Tax=Litoribaculum gwangyangense TaxID=1130722 RepID=A0ABP9CPN8_9FLAO